MSKDLISFTRTVNLAICQSMSDQAGSDMVATEVDVGTARNGLLVISKLGAGSWGEVGVYSSDVATILTNGTRGNSDNLVSITQDTVNSAATATISSKLVTIPTTSGCYVFHLEGLSRYVNMQLNPSASDTAAARRTMTATLVATALEQAPYAAATTAY